MQGARGFLGILESGQFGRLYICFGSHARGRTLRIFVLPEGVTINEKSDWNAPRCPDAVEVYGVINGNPGWTECYGWLHRGPWEEDFAALVNARRDARDAEEQRRRAAAEIAGSATKAREAALLANYNQAEAAHV